MNGESINSAGASIKSKGEDSIPENLPGIELEPAMKRLGNNMELFCQILKKFENKYSGVSGELKSLLDAGDLEEAKKLSHTVKGVAGNISAMELQKATGDLETVIAEHRTNDFEGSISKFQSALDRALESVSTIVEEKSKLKN